jgi:hypothetical protein
MIAELVRRPIVRSVSARPAFVALIALLSATALGACGRSSLRTVGFDGGAVQTGRAGNDGGVDRVDGRAGNDGGVDRVDGNPDGRAGTGGGGSTGGGGQGGVGGTGGRVPVQLVVAPSFRVIPQGGQEMFTATLFYSDGASADVSAAATWSTSDPSVAGVKAGSVYGFNAGRVEVRASYGSLSASAALVVMSSIVLVNISVDPVMNVLAIGASTQLTVTGFYSDGSTADLTAQAGWSSSSTDVATVDVGRVTAWKAGGSTITAGFGGYSASAVVSVTPATVVAVTVLPPFATIGAGGATRFTADATLSDGSHADVTTVALWSVDATVATIDGRGLVHARAPGKTLVSASFGGATGFGTLVVTGARLTSLFIEPADPTVGVGVALSFRAVGLYSDGTRADVTEQVMWQTSNPTVLPLDGRGRGVTRSVGTALVLAYVDNLVAASTVSVIPAALKSLTIQPSDVLLMAGGTTRLTAVATYADGTTFDVTDSVTWTSASPMIVAVSSAAGSGGVVRALQPGQTTVTARLAEASASARVTVSPAALTSLTIEPQTSAVAVGGSIALTARGTFADGSTRDLTNEVFWSSTDDGTATVANIGGGRPGLVTGVKAGSVTIAAFYGAVASKALVTVLGATLSSISISPAGATTMAGQRYAYTAKGVYSDGSTADLTADVVWSTDNPGIATVSNGSGTAGLLLARSAGTTVVTARLGAVVGRTTVTVAGATPFSLTIQPSAATTTLGTPLQFTATLVLSNGTTRNVTAEVKWSSDSPMVASIDAAGRAVPISAGTTKIAADYPGLSASTTLTVTPAIPLQIDVTPKFPSLAVGTIGQLAATAVFSDGSTRNVTNLATWVSSSPGVVGVDSARNRGRITALSQGKAEVTATFLGLAGSTTVIATEAVVTNISVTPTGASVAVGASRQFIARAIRSDGTSTDVTLQASWFSDAPMTANVVGGGLVTGLSAGGANISALYQGLTGSASVKVTSATVMSVQVTPSTPTLSTGTTQPFVATAIYSDGSSVAVTASATWKSSAQGVASVSDAAGSRGLATTLAAGVTSISATYMGVTGATTLTVTEATILQIQVTPFDPTIPAGLPQALTATAIYSDGSNRNVTSLATWTSSAPNIAGVSDAPATKGLLTTFAAGTTTVEARFGGVVGKATVKVIAAALLSIDVQPGMAFVAAGDIIGFRAYGRFDDGSTLDISNYVTWTSTDLAVADVSNADGSRGDAKAFSPGTTSIVARRGVVTGRAFLSVK